MNRELFCEALSLAVEPDLGGTQGGSEYSFSPRFEKKMNRLIRQQKKPFWRYTNTFGKRLALKESDWPMEVTTPTPPKVREPRPARLDRQGNALAERRQAAVAAKPAARPARPASSRPTGKVTIGRDGQIHSRPAARGTGRPVHRVNRQKRRG